MSESLEYLKNLGKYYKREPQTAYVITEGGRAPIQEVLASIPSIVIVPEEVVCKSIVVFKDKALSTNETSL